MSTFPPNAYDALLDKLNKSHAPLKEVWFALDLYSAIQNDELSEIEQEKLYQSWLDIISMQNWGNLTDRRIEYAIHLANYPSDFIFEDMFKLVVTLQEIEILKSLGITASNLKEEELHESVKRRFDRQTSLFKSTIKNITRYNGDQNWWFYHAL